MKLTSVTVRNFRSYVTHQGQPTPSLSLGDGINLLVGPNNCGKSNLLRAVSLALEDSGGDRFEPEFDIPSQLTWAYPVITLGFRCEGKTTVERTLLKLVKDYEMSAGAETTNADNGEIILRVVYRTSGRDELFAVKGAPNKQGDEKKLEKALSQFRKSIRFIYLKSGESLNNFLSGAFKELLHTVLQEHLSAHVAQANRRRDQYISELTADLLAPLGKHAQEQLAEVMEEIKGVTVEPFVPDLEETLSRASIIVRDSAKTTLINKGIRHHTYRKEEQSWISEGWVLGRKKGEKLPRKTRIEVKDDGNTHIHHRTVEGEPEKTQIWKRTSGAEE